MSARDELSIEVINILKDWADWMHSGSVGRGYPRRSAGISTGYVLDSFDDMCERMDAQVCRVVDSCVDDLPPNQSAAIYRCYLSAVFRMRNYEQSRIDAHEALFVSFRRKGVLHA